MGQQVQKKKSIDGGKKDKGGSSSQEMVQGGLERCPLGQALRQTEGRKARNAILQTIQTCELKDSCYCLRDVKKRKTFTNFTKEKAGEKQWLKKQPGLCVQLRKLCVNASSGKVRQKQDGLQQAPQTNIWGQEVSRQSLPRR